VRAEARTLITKGCGTRIIFTWKLYATCGVAVYARCQFEKDLPPARGRPGVRPSEVVLRAENYRRMFWDYRLDKKKKEYVRDKPSDWAMQLLASKTVEDVEQAFQSRPLSIQNEVRPIFPLILLVLRESTFPKQPETQLDFLADSIAAKEEVAPRTSRDICEKERAKEHRKSRHRILRHEYYVECSCGYKGPARDNACRKCGAEIGLAFEGLIGPGLF
jgi:hypothetical protein